MADIVITEDLTYAGATIGTATITISREGQVDPDTSDEVKVKAELELPAQSEDENLVDLTFLHADLQFEARVLTVFDAELNKEWSALDTKCARTKEWTGTDFAVLETTAQAYAEAELQKLTDALDTRQAALDAAG
jgi:phage host-nuclease inhibitor protein Gam